MLSEIIPGIAFAAWAYSLAQWRVIAIGLAPLLVLCASILIGYVAGFAHCFTVVHHVLVVTGLIAGLFTGIFSLRPKIRTLASTQHIFLISGVLCVLMLYFTWYYDGVLFSYYDEFFWGAFAKSFFYEDGLWTSLSALARDDMTQAYPPMPAILANTFMPLKGTFTEQSTALGGIALVLSTAAIAYHYSYERLGTAKSLGLAFIVACAVRTIGAKCEGYYLVGYTDYLQGALFASLLLVAIFEKSVRHKFIVLLLGLPVLALCKQTGIILCLCVIVSALLEYCLQQKKISVGTLCLQAVILLFPVVATYGVWSAYTQKYISQASGNNSLLNFSAAWADPLLWPSLKAYLWACIERPLLISPSLGWLSYGSGTFAFLFGIAGIYALTRYYGHRWPRGYLQHLGLLFLGAVAWFMLHWYAGFVFFVEPDLHNAASYERYIGPYISGMWAVFLVMFFTTFARSKYIGLLLGINIAALALVCSTVPWDRPAHVSYTPVRQKMEQAARYIEQHSEEKSRIYFIPYNGSTEEEWAFRYLLLPTRFGTSLVPQALKVEGQARPQVKRFLVPPVQQREQLFREHAVDYVFIFLYDPSLLYDPGLSPEAYPYLYSVKNK